MYMYMYMYGIRRDVHEHVPCTSYRALYLVKLHSLEFAFLKIQSRDLVPLRRVELYISGTSLHSAIKNQVCLIRAFPFVLRQLSVAALAPVCAPPAAIGCMEPLLTKFPA